MIPKNSKIYIAGHRGMVGSAIVKNLHANGFTNLVLRTRSELDLTDQPSVVQFFEKEKPEYVFLAAAKVGGIVANNTYPVEFISDNLKIQSNIIDSSYRNSVKRLLFLGSSCIYPKFAPQPLKEEYLLSGPLEPTNRAYALAKIAGIEMCWSYNRQYKTNFLAAMPTNLYGYGDHYHPENSHVIPGLIRRFHSAVMDKQPTVTIWGSGTPRREFLFSNDLAEACIHLINLPDEEYEPLCAKDRNDGIPPLINIGMGSDLTIKALAETIARITHFQGTINFDQTRPDGTPRKWLDSSRIHTLGWTAKTPLEKGLAVTYEDFKTQLDQSA